MRERFREKVAQDEKDQEKTDDLVHKVEHQMKLK
jgi:hypothetical protein